MTQRRGTFAGHRVRAGRILAAVGLTAGLVAAAAAPAAAGHSAPDNRYTVTNLVSDQPGVAQLTDSNLQNAWGLAAGPATPIWVANNHTDSSTVYKGGTPGNPIQGPLLTVPIDGGAPTGIVYNGTTGFTVSSASAPATFIFDSEAGDITAWSSADAGAHAVIVASNRDADYKGLALAQSKGAPYLYATAFGQGAIDVYDSSFTLQHWAGAFVDPNLPSHYSPFGIDTIGNELYVSYALHTPGNDDDVAGPHRGFVDVFGTNGAFHRRLVSRGELDSPWGMTVATKHFGRFAGDLLVGNFGNGHIHAYNRFSGQYEGAVRDANGDPVVIDGLWALEFGNGITGDHNTLLFSAGPDDEAHGLFGSITVTAPVS
ncbi:MAG TPA: TIGR03118 family protein [Acidimicrobiia bacterium]|nr:TIGR03118 family protein [Acidimicrobiia bacterium]